MTKRIIYNETFYVSGMMCHAGCHSLLRSMLESSLEELNDLPIDVQLNIDYQPQGFGILGVQLILESEEDYDVLKLSEHFKENIQAIFELVDSSDIGSQSLKNEGQSWSNWLNIAINLLAMIALISLWIVFPPSLGLTIGLTCLTFLTTALTARNYLSDFFKNLYHKTFNLMPTSITLGWTLSLAHSLYHGISMPLSASASMMFMNFIMPVALVTIVNAMDELKLGLMQKSAKMQAQGIKSLFPEMAEEYYSLQLSEQEAQDLATLNNTVEIELFIKKIILEKKLSPSQKGILKKDMLVAVKQGQCFPVDGYLLQTNTWVDSSIVSGKFYEAKKMGDLISAGSINLGQDVMIRAAESVQDSTVNKTLLVANRKINCSDQESQQRFTYLYAALIIICMITAIALPLALGIFTVPLLLQNLTGILFSICPCTLAIAHELPSLLSMYQRYKQNISIRNTQLIEDQSAMDIIVFDKTGTLTTGDSEVESFFGIDEGLWQRIYLLEKHYGRGHPIAQAIIKHHQPYEESIHIKTIDRESVKLASDGLSACVQNRNIHLGSVDYFARQNIRLPSDIDHLIQEKTHKGLTPICVAEDGKFCAVLFIKHQLRKGVVEHLEELHRQGKQLIMLTGDKKASAEGFSRQFGSIFHHIEADQTPEGKEKYISELLAQDKSKKVWFIGDGLNDIRCARKVTEAGGVSVAMNATDKAAFFSDISLNGSLEYLIQHNQLNQFAKKIVKQNQGIMLYSTLAFLAFIISFSLAGIALSPLIPMLIMVTTTGFILFNTYRTKLSVDLALEETPSIVKQALISDFSLGLLLLGTSLLITSIIIAAVASGGLALPIISFGAGITMAISSSCLLLAIGMLTTFGMVFTAQILQEKSTEPPYLETKYEPKDSIKSRIVKEPVSAEISDLSIDDDLCDRIDLNR